MTTVARMRRSTPVLAAADYERARDFYCEKLGCTVVEEGGDPPRFGIFERDKCTIFVNAWHGPRAPKPEVWSAYIHVSDVDGIAAELRGKGVQLSRDITNTLYGMREFDVTDPDGNVLCFGQDSDEAEAASS